MRCLNLIFKAYGIFQGLSSSRIKQLCQYIVRLTTLLTNKCKNNTIGKPILFIKVIEAPWGK